MKAERREEIVDALLTLMSRKGWTESTIAEIAREAGMLPGAVHHFFENKQAILVALVERLARGIEARASRKLEEAGDDPLRKLEKHLAAYVELGPDADPRAVAAWVVIAAEAVRDREVRALYSEHVRASLDAMRVRVAEVLRAEGKSTRNAIRIASALLSAIEGAYLLSSSAPNVMPAGYAFPMIRRMAHGLIVAEGQGAE